MGAEKISPYIAPGLKLSIDRIFYTVVAVTKVAESDIRSKSRFDEILMARHLFFYFCCTKLNDLPQYHELYLSLQKIGNYLHMNHASVMHSQKVIGGLLQSNQRPRVTEHYEMIEEKLSMFNVKNYPVILKN